MAYNMASKDLLTQAYAAPQAALGQVLNYQGAQFMHVLSKDTITVGMLCAWKPSVSPSARQVIRHDHTNTTTAGLASGFACASNVTGQYFFIQVGGPYISGVSPTLITDGSAAINDFCIPSATTDGTIINGTLGTNDGIMVCRNSQADSSNDLTEYVVCGPLMGK